MSLDCAANERRMTYKRQYETEYIVHVIQQLMIVSGRRIFFEHTNSNVSNGSPMWPPARCSPKNAADRLSGSGTFVRPVFTRQSVCRVWMWHP